MTLSELFTMFLGPMEQIDEARVQTEDGTVWRVFEDNAVPATWELTVTLNLRRVAMRMIDPGKFMDAGMVAVSLIDPGRANQFFEGAALPLRVRGAQNLRGYQWVIVKGPFGECYHEVTLQPLWRLLSGEPEPPITPIVTPITAAPTTETMET